MGSQQGCGCIQHLLRVRSEHGRSYRLTVSRAKLAGRRPGERAALYVLCPRRLAPFRERSIST